MDVIEGPDDRYVVLRALGPHTLVAQAESSEREVLVKRVATPPPDELSHPHLPFVYEAFEGHVVYQLIEGTSLAQLWAEGRLLSERETATWHRHVLEALQYMHDLGIAHGDVTAENILICEDRETYLVDATTKPGTAADDLQRLAALLSLAPCR